MSLADLIRKRSAGNLANANPAKAANDERVIGRPLAGLAALALANRPAPSRQISPEQAANETASEPVFVDRRELAHIVAVFHKAADDDDAEAGQAVRDALAQPELAMRCYMALMVKRTVH